MNYLGPLLNYVGPLLNYVGPHLNYLGSHLNYLGQLLNYNACVWYITNHYQPLLSAIISHYWGPCRSARRPRWTAAAGGGGRPGAHGIANRQSHGIANYLGPHLNYLGPL